DSLPANDPDVPKPMLTQGKVSASGGNFFPNACTGANCTMLANDQGMPITADHLFGAVRKNANFRRDINSLLDRMVGCLRDQIVVSGPLANGKIADSPTACYSAATHPRGYYPNYSEMIFVSGPATVNGSTCAGALLFAGQRSAGQVRITPADKAAPANYLEGTNQTEYLAGTNTFAGPDLFDRVGPTQTAEQDILRCIPAGASLTTVTSPVLTALGFGQLVTYDPVTSTLVLGRVNVTTGTGAPAGALFGCAWMPEEHPLGNGARIYFQFQFKKLGTNVGSNGFTFVLADALKNGLSACGAAGSHLGYSGNNGVTPPIAFPKLAVEFDQSRNSGFDEDPFNPGRNDPCGTSGCGGTAGYNSHAAIVYWGHQTAGLDGVTLPGSDDNVHGFPVTVPASRPPPVNPPGGAAGTAFVDLRGQSGGDSHLFHVRIDVVPTRTLAPAAQDSNTSFATKVWIIPSATVTPQVIAMQNTTTPVTSFPPTLQDTAVLYDVPETGSFCNAATPCPTGQACGTDNVCYRQALQKLRAGFTNSQRTTDQEITISNIITTWMQ
ncbi:MAG: hypothetical protein HGA21_14190, partial [Burkholderiaceae bacterium]|nr:hypothetical protein [Burkholderiaceae bacterium]